MPRIQSGDPVELSFLDPSGVDGDPVTFAVARLSDGALPFTIERITESFD